MKKIIVLLFSFFLFSQANASHIVGGDITYKWIGPGANTYIVSLNLFRDCSGISMSINESIVAQSTCGANLNFNLNIIDTNGVEINLLCPASTDSSTCNGGNYIGIQFFQYQDTITLSPNCSDWTLKYFSCCRNSSINVPTSSADDIYFETKLKTNISNYNNSPIFSSNPFVQACANQTFYFNIEGNDMDGDSLIFEIVPSLLNTSTTVIYGSGYSPSQPIPGISINSQTGVLSFNTPNIGVYILAVKVSEYNTSGQFLGAVMRDFEIIVTNCNNQLPNINSGVITNLSSNASTNSAGEIEICAGNLLTFDAIYTDNDSANSLSVYTNLTSILDSSNINISYSGTNPLTVNYSIQIPIGMSNFSFNSTIADDHCPFIGVQIFTYHVNVNPNISNIPNQTICGNDSIQLNVVGGNTFTWYDVSGNLIPVDATFSCNPCANPIISPTQTTTYIVQSDLQNACIAVDTFTVNYSNNTFDLYLQDSAQTCFSSPLPLIASTSVAGNYTYNWQPQTFIDSVNSSNPQFLATSPGNFLVHCTAINSDGCSAKDSIQISVSNNSNFNATATSDTTCIGSPNQLQVSLTGIAGVNLSCGATNSQCQNGSYYAQIGQGNSTNGNSGYPAVFGNFYWGAKHQILYQANELIAMGANSGTINSVAFYVTSLNGSTASYSNIEVKIKCTNSNTLNSFEGGLTTVYTAAVYNVQVGWNTFNFNNNYNWDGISNLLVQVCFQNISWDDNCSNTYTTTPFNSVVYFRADNFGVCQNSFGTVSTQRPNIKFGFCSTILSPNDYTFNWSPSGYLNNSTIYNPLTTVPNAGTYQVIVTDIVGGCTDTATVIAQNNGVIGALAPVIVFDSITLSTDPAYAYQWFYNGVAIAGADSASIVPLLSGDYTVQIFDSTVCSAFSAPYTVIITNVDNQNANSIQIFPNPAQNFIDIKITGSKSKHYVQIITMEGVLLKDVHVESTDRIPLDNFTNGIYLLKISDSNGSDKPLYQKFIVNN